MDLEEKSNVRGTRGDDSGSTPPSPLSPEKDAPSRKFSEDEMEKMEESETDLELQQENISGQSANEESLYPAPSKTIMTFPKDDPGNPYQWSYMRRAIIVFQSMTTVLNSTLSSSLTSGDVDPISSHFNITSNAEEVLPISIFLVGYIFGPLLFGPLSESHGRRLVMFGTFGVYTVFSLAICFSPNYTAFIIFRFLCGTFASSPIAIVGGIYADLYDNPTHRGRAMSLFMGATAWGPIFGTIASGYLSVYSWRWPLWFGFIVAGVSWIPLAFLPETFGPIILKGRAKKVRKETGSTNCYAQIELDHTSWRDIIVKVLARPFRMFFTEPLVLFSCLFLCLIYGIYYMFFQVFPIIYEPLYGFSPGEEGLSFLPIGVGTLIACGIYLWWDSYLEKAKAAGKEWAQSEEYRRLPLGCIGGPFFSIGMFWVGWAAQADVHWIVPMLGGIPLGLGFLLLFMSLINYIVDAYQVYAASAMAAASCSRSVFGAILPFAGQSMFSTLGISWACSLLGFLSLAMCAIPFIFLKYGHIIRARSKFCQQLMEEKKEREAAEEYQRKRQEHWERKQSRQVEEEKQEV